MNKKIYVLAICLGLASTLQAQEVPLFGDSTPNLGRSAKPQNTLHLTPTELPDVSVSLDNTPSKRSAVVTLKPQQTAEPKAREPLKIPGGNRFSEAQSDALSKQLDQSLDQSRQVVQQPQEPPKMPSVVEDPMPESLQDLFGKTHDVHAFDISGMALGMTPEEILEVAKERGYTVTRTDYDIPLYRTSFYAERCRAGGHRRPEVIQSCIVDLARADEVHYLSSLTLARPESAEYMQVLFSTNATGNQAYKIFYENKGDNSLNFTRRNLAKKARRRDAFWNMVYETYGYPDDKEQFLWGDPQRAYMKAAMQGSSYNAYLMLEDKEITDGDYAEAADVKTELPFRQSFTFANNPADGD